MALACTDKMTLEKQLSDSITSFSFDLYKKAAQSAGDTNMFVSPSSIFTVLAMLHAGARKNTLAEMTSTLKLQNFETPSSYDDMGKFLSLLMKGNNSVTLNCANRLYPNADRSIIETYLLLVKRCFSSTVKSLDYKKDPEGCRNEINDWVETETKKKIKDLLPSGSITSDTGMVVVNAIYFKGDWLTTFASFDTMKRDFSKNKATRIKVEMMNKKFQNVRYGDSKPLDCTILEMYYKGKDHGLVVLLPRELEGLAGLESKLTLETMRAVMASLVRETVIVSLPKFKMESSLKLKPMLAMLGIKDAFDMNKADFTGIGDQLFLSEVFHKTFVDVNEEGTEAAAATAGVMMLGCAFNEDKPLEFKADHPFLFMIWDHRIDAPLFVGRFCGPQ